MYRTCKYYVCFTGKDADEYRIYVVDSDDVDLFLAWKPGAAEIGLADVNQYAYWLPNQAMMAGQDWRGGYPPRPDGRHTGPARGRSGVAEQLATAAENARIATAQLLDRWIRRGATVAA